jgi:hypothetical protein
MTSFGGGQSEVTSKYKCRMFVNGSTLLAFNDDTAYSADVNLVRRWYPPKEVTKVFALKPQKYYDTIKLPLKHWPDLREAIKAYNEFYSGDRK